ncbi:MAG TPA: haloacid dehalogenase type II [Thermomicrobiales bacterium]|nr:haloacid dehalogenase type II [Thermomicrobiales bacterium]
MNSSKFGGFHGIVFDVYGTLFDIGAIVNACQEVTDDGASFSRLWRTKQLEYSVLRTVMDRYADFGEITSDALEYTSNAFGIALLPLERRRLMQAWQSLPAYPDVPLALDQLHAAGQRMLVLSNGSRQMLDPLLEQSGLTPYFGAVLSSEQVQSYKPDAAMYQLITERIYARMNEVLFVTANGFDIAGAKAAGLTVCRVNREGLPLDPLGFEPDIVVSDLGGLVDALTAG